MVTLGNLLLGTFCSFVQLFYYKLLGCVWFFLYLLKILYIFLRSTKLGVHHFLTFFSYFTYLTWLCIPIFHFDPTRNEKMFIS